MADEPLESNIPQPDAGAAFRAEMALQNAILGYWKHVVAIVAIGLLGVLIYGQYQSWAQAQQRGFADAIAAAQSDLPRVPPQGPSDDDKQVMIGVADRLAEVGSGAWGIGRVEAYLFAAEIYRAAGASAQQRTALEAVADEARGPMRFAVIGALANLDLEEDKGDSAIARLRSLTEGDDAYLSEQATLDLALALEHLGRLDEAKQAYDGFLQRWPESPRAETARTRLGRLNG